MFNQNIKNPDNKGILKSIRHIDHITYVAAAENEQAFIDRWAALGFHEHVRLNTIEYPATHIALVSGITAEYPWATMTGLSVSDDASSPINEFVRRYGEGVQHCAYNIDPEVDFEKLHEEMKSLGWQFMTPVLTYVDDRGSRLRQMFIKPTQPYGLFLEFIQRLEGENGSAFDGFDIQNIDGLYKGYAAFSRSIDK